MAHQVVAVHADDSVEHVETLMRESQVRRLPVLDQESRPVGLVSLNDLARLSARARKSAVDRELVQTVAAVSQPRPRPDGLATSQPIARAAIAV